MKGLEADRSDTINNWVEGKNSKTYVPLNLLIRQKIMAVGEC
jgi:hypothetical protein